MNFQSSFKLKLIYVFRISDQAHKGCLKIGETTFKDSVNPLTLQNNCSELNKASRERINEYTSTAGINYDLLHTELTLTIKNGQLWTFNDGEVHKVLRRSGIKRKYFNTDTKANEWFETDLETVKNAIKAAKENRTSLLPGEISNDRNPIEFRPEQRLAIDKTKKRFAKSNHYLWNAKMRFGKTLSALQLVKEVEFNQTLILTHRPVVDDGWFEDYHKIFYNRYDFEYGSKSNGEVFESLKVLHNSCGKKYIYFASMQDLRGSELVGGNFDKNNEIFATPWDLVIIDEAHEGTKTELGEVVITELTKPHTKILKLSGTPFNLLDDYDEEDIYTWDYVMEQRAKQEWNETHWGDPNPYDCLPKLNIYTYDLSLELKKYQDEEHAFNFKEFFRTGQNGLFIHSDDIDRFLNLLATNSATSQYPYSTLEWRRNFRHSLWTIPGVKEAKALKDKLEQHPVFGTFQIVNVAGDGITDDDYESDNALEMVKEAIGPESDETWTITLSCGRLTTGVSVPQWTAVFMLSGSFSTSASSYMQTIFRVQTPATIHGRIKQDCFVFDFAPDRTLKVLAETAKISARAGKSSESDEQRIKEFLNFCPVISFHGSQMSPVNVPHMMQQLKRVYVERVVRNGFEDGYLYNDNLFQLSEGELQEFIGLKDIIGQTKAMPKTNDVDVNNQGFTNEEYEQIKGIEKKKKQGKELTEEEKKLFEERKEKKKNRDTAVSILRGISIRMPMILYGAKINNEDEEITLDNFTSLIDPQSWEEFMPRGVTKQHFNSFKKYYDKDIFAAAGKRIRELARAADKMDVEDRIERITSIFTTFRNPDKETVLTPWRVVNMHLGDTLGGYVFFNEEVSDRICSPRFVDKGNVTTDVFTSDSKILDINSKSGLYPLYAAYSIYRKRLETDNPLFVISEDAVEQHRAEHLRIWDEVLRDNLFIVCKTPMAKSITWRTLAGFRNARVNAKYFEDLINQIINKKDNFISKVTDGQSYWKTNNDRKMKFNAIVGNPPYQLLDGGSKASASPIYNKFVDIAKAIKPSYVSMIMPAKWYTDGKGLGTFRDDMLQDKRIKVLVDYTESRDCFSNVDIAGGVCYFLWDQVYNGDCLFTSVHQGNKKTAQRDLSANDDFIRHVEAVDIIDKIKSYTTIAYFDSRVSVQKPFGLRTYVVPMEHGDLILKYNQGKGPYESSLIKVGIDMINKWKVIISYLTVEHAGQTDKEGRKKILSSLDILAPKEICTETYLVVDSLDLEEDAKHLYSYMKTQFVRFLIAQLAATQHLSKEKFAYVPLQDFTNDSDIDWTKPVADIDKQLYAKYELTNEEISFIESMIKPMV